MSAFATNTVLLLRRSSCVRFACSKFPWPACAGDLLPSPFSIITRTVSTVSRSLLPLWVELKVGFTLVVGDVPLSWMP